ncbi:hypothetical protein BNJ_00231 [Kaumoebavirus]|uniref:hypothetical protein n=1 Tax=Kaumoebavirus TaxID=1859492 RepID=UPI0009C2A48F|nr:hypothetical protein BNJ_00231 [Kaumoebavirus]ARA72060.1 hypothetical protein BNJ_00231 [Kaumoebavirus]
MYLWMVYCPKCGGFRDDYIHDSRKGSVREVCENLACKCKIFQWKDKLEFS